MVHFTVVNAEVTSVRPNGLVGVTSPTRRLIWVDRS